MTRKLLPTALAALLIAGTAPNARAGSLDLNSSMSAVCIGTLGCDQVRFDLQLQGDYFVDFVRLVSSDPTTWQFGTLVSVTDRYGTSMAWSDYITGDELTLKAMGDYAAEPIYITVGMSTYGGSGDLHTGLLSYSGSGNTLADGTGQLVSFNGTVSPEPVTVLLLGSGLLGMAGVARRRRRAGIETEV